MNCHSIFENSNVYRHDLEIYIIIYVDDFFIVEFNKEKIVVIKQKLFERFHMSNLKFAFYYLNLKIYRDRRNKIIRIN